jgi:hypothetical protein
MTTTTAVATAKPKALEQVSTPFQLIANAVQSGSIDIETIKELRALQKEMKADAAQEAFIQAMASFQAECPTIEKGKSVMNGNRLMYKYAPLDVIVATVRPILAKHKLAYSVTVEQTDTEIKATCKITHSDGHSETSSFAVPTTAGTNLMSAPQKVASAMTYAKRYAFCNVLGILTGDEDQDATDVAKDKEAKDPKARVLMLLKTLGEDVSTREKVIETVKRLTGLESTNANMDAIIDRLSESVSQRNADNSTIL